MGGFDPNDMLVFPEGDIKRDEELSYKIRFQNVGNAEVDFVEVRNQLPDELDIKTLELGAVSHPYQFRIENGHDELIRQIYTNEIPTDVNSGSRIVNTRVKPFFISPVPDNSPGPDHWAAASLPHPRGTH